MDAQTLEIVAAISQVLEDEHGHRPSRFTLELTYGRIGRAIDDLITVARSTGNACMDGTCPECNEPEWPSVIHELTQDECDALGLDGRDGAGTYVYVDLDWASDFDPADPEDAAAARADADGSRTAWGRGLHAAVIDPCGPGGGWPVVRFTGGIDAITKLVAAYNNE